jgi:hypothetical protein
MAFSAVAQPSSATPANATKTPYSTSWRCDAGFVERRGACIAVVVPENAYSAPAAYGRGWDCRRGFRRSGDSCAPISLPDNAYLTAAGDGWDCARGFRRSEAGCGAVVVPANEAALHAPGVIGANAIFAR